MMENGHHKPYQFVYLWFVYWRPGRTKLTRHIFLIANLISPWNRAQNLFSCTVSAQNWWDEPGPARRIERKLERKRMNMGWEEEAEGGEEKSCRRKAVQCQKVNFIQKPITIKLSQKCCSKLITLPSNEPIILNIYYKCRILRLSPRFKLVSCIHNDMR